MPSNRPAFWDLATGVYGPGIYLVSFDRGQSRNRPTFGGSYYGLGFVLAEVDYSVTAGPCNVGRRRTCWIGMRSR